MIIEKSNNWEEERDYPFVSFEEWLILKKVIATIQSEQKNKNEQMIKQAEKDIRQAFLFINEHVK